MKKFCSIVTAVIIASSLASCGAKNMDNSSNNSSNKSASSNISYTKEIAYFPSYTGAKLDNFTPATKKAPLATAQYKIENVTNQKVYEYYENTLKEDGWTITEAKRHFSIAAKKDNHMVNILIQKMDKDVILVVTSK